MLEQIGRGDFGVVTKALKEKTGQLFAIKTKVCSTLEEVKDIENEILTMQSVDHPNLIKIKDAFASDIVDKGNKKCSIIIVMELASRGNLVQKLSQMKGIMLEDEILTIFLDICKGTQQLHKNKIVHRGLKPENVVFNGYIWKITDFGLSRVLKDEAKDYITNGSKGTRPYYAPELWVKITDRLYTWDLKKIEIGEQCDIWALGIILYEMNMKARPY